MSIYENREESIWSRSSNTKYANNPYILSWWTNEHDSLLDRLIQERDWIWNVNLIDEICSITPPEIIEEYKLADPLCQQYVWYNILRSFALSRASLLKLTDNLSESIWLECPSCGERFVNDSLPYPLIERLNFNQIDFCSPCLKEALLDAGNDSYSKEQIISFLKSVSELLECVPSQNFYNVKEILHGMTTSQRLPLIQVLKEKPSVKCVKNNFGSWLEALIEAEILEDGTRRTSRGTQCIAKDGHLCYSLGEKTIDDLLYSNNVSHEREPYYPESNFRADFSVNGVFIEYFGLAGNSEYDEKIALKRKLCKQYGIKLIEVYPKDLTNSEKLRSKIIDKLSTH